MWAGSQRVGSLGNEAQWQVNAGQGWQTGFVYPLTAGIYAIGITDDLSGSGTPLPGLNLGTWSGSWAARYQFTLPVDATNLQLHLGQIIADDKAIIYVNGMFLPFMPARSYDAIAGFYALHDAEGPGTFEFAPPIWDATAVVNVTYSRSFNIIPIPAFALYTDRPNEIMVVMNNTGSTRLDAPMRTLQNLGDQTFFFMDATVTYDQPRAFSPPTETQQVGTKGNETVWKVNAAGTWETPYEGHAPTALPEAWGLGITNTLTIGTPIPGLDLGIWNGSWMARYSFALPGNAMNPKFRINRAMVDDKASIFLNGQLVYVPVERDGWTEYIPGYFAYWDATGTGEFSYVPPFQPNVVTRQVEFTRGQNVFPTQTFPLYTDKLNEIEIVLNNTGSTYLWKPLHNFVDDGDYTYASLDAEVTYETPMPGMLNLVTTAPLTRWPDGKCRADVTIKNVGTGTAENVVLTTATLNGTSGAHVPFTLGNIDPMGGTGQWYVYFTCGTPGTMAVQRYGGTYKGGTFTGSLRTVVP